jgi:hypothetical protein
MAEMSMNRVIHAAFRRDLDRYAGALATFADGDTGRARQLGVAWANFNVQLTNHHEGEHEIAWPALQSVGVGSDVIDQMNAEHDRLNAELATADSAMTKLAGSASGDDAAAAGKAIAILKQVAAEHLDHEEAVVEPVFLSKKDTPELKAMGRKFGKVAPPVAGTFFAWLQDGASAEELAAIRTSVPGPVLMILGGLFGRKYRRQIQPAWR